MVVNGELANASDKLSGGQLLAVAQKLKSEEVDLYALDMCDATDLTEFGVTRTLAEAVVQRRSDGGPTELPASLTDCVGRVAGAARQQAMVAMEKEGWPRILAAFPNVMESPEAMTHLHSHICSCVQDAVAQEDYLRAGALQEQAAHVHRLLIDIGKQKEQPEQQLGNHREQQQQHQHQQHQHQQHQHHQHHYC